MAEAKGRLGEKPEKICILEQVYIWNTNLSRTIVITDIKNNTKQCKYI